MKRALLIAACALATAVAGNANAQPVGDCDGRWYEIARSGDVIETPMRQKIGFIANGSNFAYSQGGGSFEGALKGKASKLNRDQLKNLLAEIGKYPFPGIKQVEAALQNGDYTIVNIGGWRYDIIVERGGKYVGISFWDQSPQGFKTPHTLYEVECSPVVEAEVVGD